MFIAKLKFALASFQVLVAFAISASFGVDRKRDDGPPTPMPALELDLFTPIRSDDAKSDKPGSILIRIQESAGQDCRLITLSPDGKTETLVNAPKGWPDTVAKPDLERSRYGKMAAFRGNNTLPRKNDGTDLPIFRAFVGSFPNGGDLLEITGDVEPAFWMRDGKSLVVRELPEHHDTKVEDRTSYSSVDLKSLKRTPIPIPDEHWLYDLSSDGRYALTSGKDPAGKLNGKRLFLVDRTGAVIRPLTDESMIPGTARFLPNGNSVLLRAYPRSANRVLGMSAFKLYRTAIDHPKLEPIVEVPDSFCVGGFDYSPDGKWVVFEQSPRVPADLNPKKLLDHEAVTDEVEFAVIVVGLDGKNPSPIKSVKTRKPFSVTLNVIDWR
jgi:hypothetical protein